MFWTNGLGIFNILWALILCFLFLGSQFSFISGAVFGLFCFITGVGILNKTAIIRRVFLKGALPLGLLSILNLIPFTSQDVPLGFHMSISDVILFAGIFIIIPLVVNFIILTRPRVKEQFK